MGRLLIVTMAHAWRAAAFVRRGLTALEGLAIALLWEVLSTEEKNAITLRLYDLAPEPYLQDGLFPWEEPWLRRRLPNPPGRALLGACGAGREGVALLGAGFRVDAFDPAPGLASTCARRLGDRARVLVFRYEDLNAAVLEETLGPASLFARQRYDVVLVGCGSLRHVLDPVERTRLLATLDRLCPDGPILMSLLTRHASASEARPGRASRLGRALGRKVVALRAIRPPAPSSEGLVDSVGFVHVFTRKEVEDLGASIGRTVVWEDEDAPYPLVTLLSQRPGRTDGA